MLILLDCLIASKLPLCQVTQSQIDRLTSMWFTNDATAYVDTDVTVSQVAYMIKARARAHVRMVQ